MSTPDLKGLVLVVEDNEDVRNIITIYLRRNGYDVAEAADGLEAVDSLSRISPDLVLLDVLLPKLDGIGVLKRLRDMENVSDTPVVMMSAVVQTRDLKNETSALNVCSFVQKPFQMRTLLAHVEEALTGRQMISKLKAPGPREKSEICDELRLRMERTDLAPTGKLENTPIPDVLHSIFVESKTGTLQVCSGTTEKLVFFQNGMPVYAESSIPEETLGAHLRKKGLITKEQHAQAVQTMTESGRHFGEVLLKLGLIGPHDLFSELESHLMDKVISVFSWHEGTYSFKEGDSWKEDVIVARMKPSRILLAGIQRYWSPSLIQKRLRISDITRTFPLNGSPYLEDQLGLSTQEMRILQLVKRGVTVGEIVRHQGDLTFAISTLYALYIMEMVGFILSPPQTASLEAKHPSIESSNKPIADKEELARVLLTEYLKFRTADYFTLLGVSRGAGPAEIEEAFRKRQVRYHPDTLVGIDAGLVHEKIEELYVRIHNAYKTLMDSGSRKKYLERLDQKAQSVPTDASLRARRFSTLQSKPIHEIVFEEGYSYLRSGDFERALNSFIEAGEIEQKPKYEAYRAWAEFLIDPNKSDNKAEETLTQLHKEHRENTEDALYPHLLGRMALKLQNTKKAIFFFERALQIDPQHIDSARQLRILRMRNRGSESSGLFDLFKKK